MRFNIRFYLLVISVLLLSGFVLRNLPFTLGDFSSDSPANRTAYDSSYHVLYSKAVYDQENIRRWPAWAIHNTESVFFHPPLLYLFMGSFGKLTTTPMYRLFYVLISFLGVWTCFQFYVLFKKYFSIEGAMIGLAFALFPSANWLMLYSQGFSMDILAFALVPLGLLAILRYIDHESITWPIVFGAALGASVISHPWQGGFCLLTLAMLVLFLTLTKKISIKKTLKFAYISGFIFFSVSINYFLLFHETQFWGTVKIKLLNQGQPIGWMWSTRFNKITILGILLFVFFWVKNLKLKSKNFKYQNSLLMFLVIGIVLLGLKYLNVDINRVVRFLFLLSTVIMFFAGVGYVRTIKIIKIKPLAFSLLLLVILVSSVYYFRQGFLVLKTINDGMKSLLSEDNWMAVKYIRDQTPKDATVFSFYGYFHNFQQFSERVSFNVDYGRDYTREVYESLCNGKKLEEYRGIYDITNYYKDHSKIAIQRNGPVSFQLVTSPTFENVTVAKIDDFDYLLVEHKSEDRQACINAFLSSIKQADYPIVYENQTTSIYKIN